MLFLSVGMPRAGSGWHYNLINDLMIAQGYAEARSIRQKYHLERFLTKVNCNIGSLSSKRLLPVLMPSLLGNTYVIKVHAGPTLTADFLLRLNLMQASYIYRDPRDALLSAYEQGKRARAHGQQNAFAQLETFDDALAFMQRYLDIWDAWVNRPKVFACRYEDLLEDYESQIPSLLGFLRINPEHPKVRSVIASYHPGLTKRSAKPGLHFRKGKIGRFREALTQEEQTACNINFAPFLEKMGYPLQ